MGYRRAFFYPPLLFACSSTKAKATRGQRMKKQGLIPRGFSLAPKLQRKNTSEKKLQCLAWVLISFIYKMTLTLILVSACSPSVVKHIRHSEVFNGNFTGFYLYDPGKQKILADINGKRYFTPASNTKIFTFYTGLKVLGDLVPALRYVIRDDSLIIWGTGDPSFLHPDLTESPVFDFLVNIDKSVYLSFSNFYDKSFGPGWAWDDYMYAYQPEKSSFPVYGNMVQVEKKKDTTGLWVTPRTFKKFLTPVYDFQPFPSVKRNESDNLLHYVPPDDTVSFNRYIPFKYNPELIRELLEDTLLRKITVVNKLPDKEAVTLYGIPSDSVFKRMMQVSDNFIAEQVMLMCAGILSDSLNTRIAIKYSKDSLLADLPDEPVWVDGSGLSRYNLFTPRSIVALWEKIYETVPEERLFNLLAAGGRSGSLKNWYISDPPYIFGKTGTLRNNHCLSGFLKTKKGNLLIFSFMNNNYNNTSVNIKREMEIILWEIHEKY